MNEYQPDNAPTIDPTPLSQTPLRSPDSEDGPGTWSPTHAATGHYPAGCSGHSPCGIHGRSLGFSEPCRRIWCLCGRGRGRGISWVRCGCILICRCWLGGIVPWYFVFLEHMLDSLILSLSGLQVVFRLKKEDFMLHLLPQFMS